LNRRKIQPRYTSVYTSIFALLRWTSRCAGQVVTLIQSYPAKYCFAFHRVNLFTGQAGQALVEYSHYVRIQQGRHPVKYVPFPIEIPSLHSDFTPYTSLQDRQGMRSHFTGQAPDGIDSLRSYSTGQAPDGII
jgi:hypothetical protein